MGCDFLTTKVDSGESSNGGIVNLQIWDTAGQERFNSIGFSFYRGADAAILVYDITNAETFQHLSRWLAAFIENCHVHNPIIMVVGNKTDKADYRVISSRQAQEFIEKNNIKQDSCIETSAKDDEGIKDLFKQVAIGMIKRQADQTGNFEIMDTVDIVDSSNNTNTNKCC